MIIPLKKKQVFFPKSSVFNLLHLSFNFQLECLAVNYCNKVTGSTMKTLFQRSRRLTCLLMNGCSEYILIILLTWLQLIKKNRLYVIPQPRLSFSASPLKIGSVIPEIIPDKQPYTKCLFVLLSFNNYEKIWLFWNHRQSLQFYLCA